MPSMRINMFGKLSIRSEEKDWTTLHSQKVCELFCYLVLHKSHPQSREHLAELFWSDGLPVQSKNYLRRSLWQLQKELKSLMGQDAGQILIVELEWLQINPRSRSLGGFCRVCEYVQLGGAYPC
jgi:DNA-binding SARP family transcriptional activator